MQKNGGNATSWSIYAIMPMPTHQCPYLESLASDYIFTRQLNTETQYFVFNWTRPRTAARRASFCIFGVLEAIGLNSTCFLTEISTLNCSIRELWVAVKFLYIEAS
jgi:hypothetical protein